MELGLEKNSLCRIRDAGLRNEQCLRQAGRQRLSKEGKAAHFGMNQERLVRGRQ